MAVLLVVGFLMPAAAIFLCKLFFDCRFSWLKVIAFVFLFEFSFLPYIYVSVFYGWIDLLYFIFLWSLFFISYFLFNRIVSFLLSFFLGLFLSVPISVFMSYYNSEVLSLGAVIYNSDANVFFVFYKLFWMLFPPVGIHFLMSSTSKKSGSEMYYE